MGLTDIAYKLATRPDIRAGDDATWDRAEAALADALRAAGLTFDFAPGEGAFYGPKLEFHLTDAIGRTWQCGTFQLDYVLPERLDATYVGEDGARHRPVMLHRAVFGSFERFIGLLIEHYAGRFPLWLAPRQVVVAPIVSEANAYAEEALAALRAAGLRAEADLRNEKINYKVREHSLAKVPVILAVGHREVEDRTVSLRRLGENGEPRRRRSTPSSPSSPPRRPRPTCAADGAGGLGIAVACNRCAPAGRADAERWVATALTFPPAPSLLHALCMRCA